MKKGSITINKVAVVTGLALLWIGASVGAHKIGELIGKGCVTISEEVVTRYWK